MSVLLTNKKVYLLVYSSDLGTQEEVKNLLNNMTEVKTWRYDIPNSFYIVSEASANELTDAIHARKSNGRFLITELSENRQGYITSDSWYFINNKQARPKETAK